MNIPFAPQSYPHWNHHSKHPTIWLGNSCNPERRLARLPPLGVGGFPDSSHSHPSPTTHPHRPPALPPQWMSALDPGLRGCTSSVWLRPCDRWQLGWLGLSSPPPSRFPPGVRSHLPLALPLPRLLISFRAVGAVTRYSGCPGWPGLRPQLVTPWWGL